MTCSILLFWWVFYISLIWKINKKKPKQFAKHHFIIQPIQFWMQRHLYSVMEWKTKIEFFSVSIITSSCMCPNLENRIKFKSISSLTFAALIKFHGWMHGINGWLAMASVPVVCSIEKRWLTRQHKWIVCFDRGWYWTTLHLIFRMHAGISIIRALVLHQSKGNDLILFVCVFIFIRTWIESMTFPAIRWRSL